MIEKTAIVLGATGLVGRALVSQLSACPAFSSVVALTRRPVQSTCDKVSYHVVDFDDLTSSQHLLKGDVLFSCLGTTKKQAGSIAAQRRVDVDYQYAAAQLAARNGVKHYVLVSSADVRSLSPYLKMKGALEDRVCQLEFERVTIFQPSLLLGRRTTQRFGEAFAGVVLPALCKLPGLKRYKPITGEQVAKKMVSVSLQPGPARAYFTLHKIF